MASEVDVCNLALARLGDAALVSSISPPDGSAQAGHCAAFYPMVRDYLLERYAWSFSLTRAALVQLSATPPSGWLYYYAYPAKVMNLLAIYLQNAPDDSSPCTFDQEVLPDGTPAILCNVNGVVAKYTLFVTNTTLWSPLFIDSLSYHLAAALAGPIIKGPEGVAISRQMFALGESAFGKATVSDASQRRIKTTHIPPWVGARANSVDPLNPLSATNSYNPPIG